MKLFASLIALVCFSTAFAAPPTPAASPAPTMEEGGTPFTIKRAIREALEHDHSVLSAREKRREVDASFSMATSTLFPTLSNTSTAYIKKDAANTAQAAFGGESYNFYSVLFTASQPIYDGSLFAALRAGEKQKEISALEVEIAERDLSLRVIQSFYTLLLNQRKLAMLHRTLEVQNKILNTARERYRIGRSKVLDVLQIKTQIALTAPKISQAQNQIEVASADLANLVGNREMKKLTIDGTLDYPDLPKLAKALPEKLKDAQLRLAELQKVKKQVEQISDLNAVTFGKHYPKLALNGTWGRSTFTKSDLLQDYSTAWTASLQLTIPLFSGLSSVYERRQLASKEAQLQIEEARQLDNASLAQIRAEKNFSLAATIIASSAQAAENAREALAEAEKEYRLSISDLIQYLNAENTFLDAESAFDQAKYDFINAATQFHISSGLTLKDFVQWLDTTGKKGN